MNEQVTLIEREQGPSWARANWPVAELDEVNLGLDPTQATIEKIKAAVAEKATAAGASRRASATRDSLKLRSRTTSTTSTPAGAAAGRNASKKRPVKNGSLWVTATTRTLSVILRSRGRC